MYVRLPAALEGSARRNPRLLDRATYSVQEAAKVLGISRNAAYEAVRAGQLPSLRFGGRIVIPRAALDRMLEQARAAGDPPELV